MKDSARAAELRAEPAGDDQPAPAHLLPTRPGLIVKRLAAALVIITAIATFALSTHNEVQLTAGILNPQAVRAANQFEALTECVYRAIRAEVPRGASIYTDSSNRFTYQQIVETSTLWATPRITLAQAEYEVNLDKAPDAPCDGRVLTVRHR
jgi:hypothetical protein